MGQERSYETEFLRKLRYPRIRPPLAALWTAKTRIQPEQCRYRRLQTPVYEVHNKARADQSFEPLIQAPIVYLCAAATT